MNVYPPTHSSAYHLLGVHRPSVWFFILTVWLVVGYVPPSRAQIKRTKLFSFRATLHSGGHVDGILCDVNDSMLVYVHEDLANIRLIQSGQLLIGSWQSLNQIRKVRVRPLARHTIGTSAAVGGAAASLITIQTLRKDQSTGGAVFSGLTVLLVGGIGAAVGVLVSQPLHAIRGRTIRPKSFAPERLLRVRLEPYTYRFRAGQRPNPEPH